MWYPEWPVLVVDDEPDVLQVTKLIMKNIVVDGIPIKVVTASSKAEAIELLQTEFAEEAGPGLLAVAFIDVVMETDMAGLELCEFIRNKMGNNLTPLYIRTGQPGVAPERSVIDNYDISGYFTKVEATEDKLYTLVKSGVRQYWSNVFSLLSVMILNDVIANSAISQERISESVTEKLKMMSQRRGGGSARNAMWAGNDLVWAAGYSVQEANAIRDRLSALPMQPVSPFGDMATVDTGSNQVIVTVPAGPNNSPATFISDGYGVPPLHNFTILAWNTRSIATLWQQAGAHARV